MFCLAKLNRNYRIPLHSPLPLFYCFLNTTNSSSYLWHTINIWYLNLTYLSGMLRHKDLHVILLGVKGESRKGLSKKLWKQYENQTHVTILAMGWLFFYHASQKRKPTAEFATVEKASAQQFRNAFTKNCRKWDLKLVVPVVPFRHVYTWISWVLKRFDLEESILPVLPKNISNI